MKGLLRIARKETDAEMTDAEMTEMDGARESNRIQSNPL
jgi:hypothetical protein